MPITHVGAIRVGLQLVYRRVQMNYARHNSRCCGSVACSWFGTTKWMELSQRSIEHHRTELASRLLTVWALHLAPFYIGLKTKPKKKICKVTAPNELLSHR